MTRETKIGLLVGLCFIIVIGILLSDHFRATMDPPAAALTDVGDNVREAVNSPGGSGPPVRFVQPQNVQPREPVRTSNELYSPPSPVSLKRQGDSHLPAPSSADPRQNQSQQYSNSQQTTSADLASGGGRPIPTPPIPQSLADAARQHGMDLVGADVSGRTTAGTGPGGTETASAGGANAMQDYTAESGDTVSRLAARFLGANTKTNRDLIIKANASLQANPDRIIVGQSYRIPAAASATTPPLAAAGSAPAAPAPAAPTTPSAAAASASDANGTYTVQSGDNLWRIARDQLGNPALVDTLKELNADILKGDNKDTVVPGMRLRLPPKAVAAAR